MLFQSPDNVQQRRGQLVAHTVPRHRSQGIQITARTACTARIISITLTTLIPTISTLNMIILIVLIVCLLRAILVILVIQQCERQFVAGGLSLP